MALFDQLCSLGDQADTLLKAKRYPEAQSAYIDILDRAINAEHLDSFIVAKVTLGYLLALVESGDIAQAHQVWTFRPDQHLLGDGIHFLENGQTSVHDLMIYFLISAHLHAHNTDNQAGFEGMQDHMQRVARYAVEEAPELLAVVIGNWRHHLEEIFELPLASVPPRAKVQLQELEMKAGPTITPKRVYFPKPSLWKIDWPSKATPMTREEARRATQAVHESDDITQPTAAFALAAAPPLASTETIEDRMDIVNGLMGSQNYAVALRQVREIKKDMLGSDCCDPSILGWVMLFEFKCLYKLGRYEDALRQAAEKPSSPYTMTPQNAAFRASMCSELCVRAGRPVEDIIAFGTESFLRKVHGDNVLHTLRTLSTSCTLLELRDAEDKAEDFARNMIEIGAKAKADVPVLRGYISLMRGKLRAGKDTELRPIVDELFGVIRELPKSNQRAELMSEVARLETSRSPLPSNHTRLARFLETSAY